jgi:hypothetical protein
MIAGLPWRSCNIRRPESRAFFELLSSELMNGKGTTSSRAAKVAKRYRLQPPRADALPHQENRSRSSQIVKQKDGKQKDAMVSRCPVRLPDGRHWAGCGALGVQFMKTRKKKQSTLTTRQGILLLLTIGTLFAIVFVSAFYFQIKSKLP